MIQLRSDCLVFEITGGDKIPCSVEKLTIEVLAESMDSLDPEVIRHAAAAVLHYFKDDLGRDTVTVDEFTQALEHVLRGLGYDVQSTDPAPDDPPDADALPRPVVEADLEALAAAAGLELDFYGKLRIELQALLSGTPRVVRFRGLRPCAKRLARVRRWCPRSVEVSDEIVRFLRDCWGAAGPRKDCALLVN
jgi:hypothetical protein